MSAVRLDGRGRRNPSRPVGPLFPGPRFIGISVNQVFGTCLQQDCIVGTGYFDADMFLNSLSGQARY